MHPDLQPSILLGAYREGLFPMADEDGGLHWYTCDPRAIIELDSFHVPRRLRQTVQRKYFNVTVDQAFEAVIDGCAGRAEGTWISRDIREAFIMLHHLGYAHSVETWHEGTLAGGLYGIALGGAFFAESKFYRVSNASKVALVSLVERMRDRGFTLLDIQFVTEHLAQFHCIEIPRSEYLQRLDHALRVDVHFVDEKQIDYSRVT